MAKIFISQPCIGGNIHTKCLQTMQLMTFKHQLEFHWIENCSLIVKARNEHLAMFINSDCDYMLSVDADIVITPPGCLDRMIEKCPVNAICAGLYAMKALDVETGKAPVNGVFLKEEDKDKFIESESKDLVEMKYVPTGFCLIPKHVARKLAENYKELVYRDHHFKFDIYNVYGLLIVKNDKTGEPNMLPEDFSFCERVKQVGNKIYADPEVKLGHIGSYLYII